MPQTYSYWHGIANSSGAPGLAAITDAPYPGGAGTDCDAVYWEARAYDVLRAILLELGSDPGAGVDGNFTVNQDNATNNTENSFLYFSRGTAGSPASLGWIAATNRLHFSHDLTSAADIGQSAIPVNKIWATDLDVADDLTVVDLTISGTVSGGSFGAISGSTTETFTIDTDDTNYTATTGLAKFNVSRGVATDAYFGFNEATDIWVAHDGTISRTIVRTGDTSSITKAMFLDDGGASAVFAGSGGGSVPVANWGVATTAARSDHSHTGGSLVATGTSETSFTLDDDYTSGSVNIELRFASSSNYIRYNPGGNAYFEVSSDWVPATSNTKDLGKTGTRWRHGWLSGNLDIAGTLGITGATTLTGGVSGNTTFSGGTVTMTSDMSMGGNITTDLDIVGTLLTLRADETTGANADFRVQIGASLYRRIRWDNSGARWSLTNDGNNYYNIVTTNSTDTMANKTLVSPVISGGTFTGTATWSGNPTFSGTVSLQGTTNFPAAPNFTVPSSAPFAITSNTMVANLNADLLDGVEGSALLAKAGGTMSGILNMGGYNINMAGGNIINLGSFPAHQSTHLSGGADALSGVLGNVTGVNYQTWSVNADNADDYTSDNTALYLGSGTAFGIRISDWSSGMMGLGGNNTDIVPSYSGGNQDMGNASRPWRTAFISHSVLFTLNSGVPSTVANGSIWMQSGTPQLFRAYLNSTARTIIDSNNKTDISGSTTSFGVPEGSSLRLNDGTNTYYWYKPAGNFSYVVSNSVINMAFSSDGVCYFYQDVRVEENKKLYLDWNSNTYFWFNTSGTPRVELYVNSVLKDTWS